MHYALQVGIQADQRISRAHVPEQLGMGRGTPSMRTYHFIFHFTYWKYVLNIEVTCPPLPVPENGALTPPDCSSVNQIYNAVCRYNCIPGYSLTLSISEVTCRETGKWSYEGNFECKGAETLTLGRF